VLTIEVVAVDGAPPGTPMSARFDENGGSIGRDSACTLVLPDPEKRISRRHVQISCRAGRFALRSQGSAIPVLLNGVPVDYGSEAALSDGDRLDIGEFSLQVRSAAAAARTLLPEAPAAPAARPNDILADFGSAASVTVPFADLIPPPPPAQPPAPVPSPKPPSRGVTQSTVQAPIPEDFDPFAEPVVAPPSGAVPQPGLATADFSDLVSSPEERIDELFGLNGKGSFPSGPLLSPGSAASTPGPVGIDDLLRPGAAGTTAPRSAPSAPAQRDDALELSARIRLPGTVPAEPMQPPPLSPQPATSETAEEGGHAPRGMMLSWDEQGQNGVFDGTRTMVIGGTTPERRHGERRRSAPSKAAVADAPSPPPAPAVADASAATERALLVALLDGLGLERWPEDRPLDADTLRRVGRLLRSAVQGTIDLLRARATIKSEVQAHLTMIVARDNNPLKFSPNAEAALAHLLGPAQKGFMSATAAMDDAYRDLVAHQFGFTAGTRAALADVLRRFDPAKLEERLAGKSMLDTVLPAHRKARLWDLFAERFAHISAEAEDDFQHLFGKEFLRAYEAQVEKMGSSAAKEKD
jgi:type VI secretion system FHA domain protein